MTAAEVSLAEDRTSPLGLWMYADSYLDAASCVMTHSRHPHRAPVYFLYAHAIEFALKAYLRSKALPVEAIEAHEHRLSPLMNACHDRGLREPDHIGKIGSAAIAALELGDTDARYVRTGFKRRPDLAALRLFAEWLLAETKQHCVPHGAVRRP